MSLTFGSSPLLAFFTNPFDSPRLPSLSTLLHTILPLRLLPFNPPAHDFTLASTAFQHTKRQSKWQFFHSRATGTLRYGIFLFVSCLQAFVSILAIARTTVSSQLSLTFLFDHVWLLSCTDHFCN